VYSEQGSKMDIQSIAEKFHFNICGTKPLRTVFTAQSKAYFYCKDAVCEFVFNKDMLPINPFMTFDYFLNDRVDRDLIRRANNHLISMCDELWVFGDIANGVMFEIVLAKNLKKPVKYHSIAARSNEIIEVTLRDLTFEKELSLTKEEIDQFINLVT
jgi:hypothetical protein